MMRYYEKIIANIPPEGISYVKAAIILNLPTNEAIAVINQLVADGILSAGPRHGTWKLETPEIHGNFKPQSCDYCCTIFFASRGGKKYCSDNCKRSACKTRAKSEKNTCKFCGIEYFATRKRQQYCSRICACRGIKR